MGLVTFTIIEIIVLSLAAAYLYGKWIYRYWSTRNIPCLKPTFLVGNMENPLARTRSPGEHFANYYTYYKGKGYKFVGFYTFISPVLVWLDLDHIRNVLSKDFNHFTDRGLLTHHTTDPLSGHLFNLEGQGWRRMRIKLTPTFTSGKMKMMFQTLVDCGDNLLQKIEIFADDTTPIDIKEMLGCYTTDIIGSCAFGIDCNSFNEEASLFRFYGRKIFDMRPTRLLSIIATIILPKTASALGVTATEKAVIQFFMKAVKDAITFREKNGVVRKDFLQLLINLKNTPQSGEQPLTIEEIAAQCFVFFVAGFETSSTTMAFALYELALHEHIQSKVRKEIKEVLKEHDGNITYEAIQEMSYLHQIISGEFLLQNYDRVIQTASHRDPQEVSSSAGASQEMLNGLQDSKYRVCFGKGHSHDNTHIRTTLRSRIF